MDAVVTQVEQWTDMQLSAILGRFTPFSGSDKATELLARYTKYSRLGQGGLEETYPVNLDDGLSIVAVVDPKGRIALVLRSLEEQLPLDGGKTFNVYAIDAICAVEGAQEARQALAAIRQAYENRVLEDIEGFGNPALDLAETDLEDELDGLMG